MKFITLTSISGNGISVNLSEITFIETFYYGNEKIMYSRIHIINESPIIVKETHEEIINLINGVTPENNTEVKRETVKDILIKDTLDKMAVMQGFVEGKKIQFMHNVTGDWVDCKEPKWAFGHGKYRIKPED